MEKKMVNSETMYFEDLPENIQEILLDLIVSGLKNTMAKDPVPIAGGEKVYQGRSEHHLGKLAGWR